MDQRERSYLEYRPKLGLSRNFRYLLQQSGISLQQERAYQMPPELADATAILASNVAQAALAAKAKADDLVKGLEDGLASLPGPVPIAEYKKALAEGDPGPVAAFDDFHASDPAGTAQGELLPLIKEAADELTAALGRLQDAFSPQGLHPEDLERSRADEAAAMDQAVVQDMKDPTQTDRQALAMRAQLVHATAEQIQNVSDFLDGAQQILQHTVNDQFKGQVRAVLREMAKASQTAQDSFARINQMRFQQLAQAGRKARSQREAFDLPLMREAAWQTAREMQQLQQQHRPTIQWLLTVDEQFGRHPMTGLMASTIGTMEQVAAAQEEAALNLFKQNELERVQRQALLDNILAKKQARQVQNLLGAMAEQFDPDDPRVDRQIKRLVDTHGLEQPGTIMSR